MKSSIYDRELHPSNLNNMASWTRPAQWPHQLTCQNGMRNSYKTPSLKEKLLGISLIQGKASWVYVYMYLGLTLQDWSVLITQSNIIWATRNGLGRLYLSISTPVYVCVYFSVAVNIPDQGCYRRVYWGLTVWEGEPVPLMLGEHGSRHVARAVAKWLLASDPETWGRVS